MVLIPLAAITVLLVALLAVWSSFHTVPAGDIEMLLVSGEERRILEPGFYFVPPFVSATYPIDSQTMEYVTPQGRQPIPVAFRTRVEKITTDEANAGEA